MSFGFNAIYIVRPLPQLVELIQSLDAEWGFLLTEPEVLSQLEQQALLKDIPLRDAGVKTLFLMGLRSEYFGDGTNEMALFLTKLVQFPHIDVAAFNCWWYLERFDFINDTCERLRQRVGDRYVNDIRPHPEIAGYDEWIRSLPGPG